MTTSGPAGRRRVVVATADTLGTTMAGPAIRAWQFASALAAEHDVELVTTAACSLPSDGRFPVRQVGAREVTALVAGTDVWVVQGNVLLEHPAIAGSQGAVVVDLYDPYHLENLENSRGRAPRDRLAMVHNASVSLNGAMRRGDFFLAASATQRHFWLGALAALGRVNPLTYDEDPGLDRLVDLVPFGVDDVPPQHTRPAIRGVVPGIGEDDLLLLWGGGIYNWFDPLTLLRAVDQVRRQRSDVRLLFLGGKHPNPAVPAMQMAARARELSDELGLTGRHVFFNEGWVPYDERGSYLLEADIGVSTHLHHVETAFSFRTRVLDYLWAGLPVVASTGDVFAPLIESRGLGAAVAPGDVDALAVALLRLLEDDGLRAACGERSRALAQEYRWDQALQPLLAFCRDPRRAPDLLDPVVVRHLDRPFEVVRAPTPGPSGWRGEVALARQYLERGGTRLLVRRALTRLGKLVRGRMH